MRDADETETSVTLLRQQLAEAKLANLALERELVERRLIEGFSFAQTRMLARSLDLLATQADLDRFLGRVLKTTVQQLSGIGGSLWFPDTEQDGVNLHLEYLEGAVFPARESRHPGARQCLPVGGRGISTFPLHHAEAYTLTESISGMPEPNRAYIRSLGFQTLLTVPMMLGRRAVGWICIRSRDPDPMTLEAKVPLAEALANQATLALQIARLSERARRTAVLEERNRIARNIHDTLAQGFTGIMLNLEAASTTLARGIGPATHEHLDTAKVIARECLSEARHSLKTMRLTTCPEGENLASGIREQQRRLELAGISAELHIDVDPSRLRTVQSGWLRIAREAVTNIIRHAQASRVRMTVADIDSGLVLTITDNGIGFDPARADHEGFGLTGMCQRAERMRATFSIRSESGNGTIVQVRQDGGV